MNRIWRGQWARKTREGPIKRRKLVKTNKLEQQLLKWLDRYKRFRKNDRKHYLNRKEEMRRIVLEIGSLLREKSDKIFGNGYYASPDELKMTERLIRKLVLDSLKRMVEKDDEDDVT